MIWRESRRELCRLCGRVDCVENRWSREWSIGTSREETSRNRSVDSECCMLRITRFTEELLLPERVADCEPVRAKHEPTPGTQADRVEIRRSESERAESAVGCTRRAVGYTPSAVGYTHQLGGLGNGRGSVPRVGERLVATRGRGHRATEQPRLEIVHANTSAA